MFLTNILLKKAKAKNIMILMESAVSGHQFTMIRERLGEKLELIKFDPYSELGCLWKNQFQLNVKKLFGDSTSPKFQNLSVYRERKKVRSM